MKTPIDLIMDRVEWEMMPAQEKDGDIPTATHSGILKIGKCEMKCYRLDNGTSVIDADDFNKFFAMFGTE